MRINQTTSWANLYHHNLKDDFISNLIKTDKPRAIKFKKASCFIHNECDLNDSAEISKSFHATYPNEIESKHKHHVLHATFLEQDTTCY